MAFTITRKNSVMGNLRTVMLKVSPDGAEENISSGLNVIDSMMLGVQTAATMAFSVQVNANSTATASNGTLGVSGVASGDVFYITCFGR